MRTITLEEHFAGPGFLEGPGRGLKEQALKFGGPAAKLLEQLCELGDKRIAEMDSAHIDMQVLSLTSPGAEQLDAAEAPAFARETNDFLADALRGAANMSADSAILCVSLPLRHRKSPRQGDSESCDSSATGQPVF